MISTPFLFVTTTKVFMIYLTLPKTPIYYHRQTQTMIIILTLQLTPLTFLSEAPPFVEWRSQKLFNLSNASSTVGVSMSIECLNQFCCLNAIPNQFNTHVELLKHERNCIIRYAKGFEKFSTWQNDEIFFHSKLAAELLIVFNVSKARYIQLGLRNNVQCQDCVASQNKRR